jgi:hypothetical protein
VRIIEPPLVTWFRRVVGRPDSVRPPNAQRLRMASGRTGRSLVDGCDTGGVLINVWVAAWQMQCCGSSFADGDLIEWTLSTQTDVAWLESFVGDEAARSVGFSWEKHGPHSEGSTTTKGVVGGIQAVRCKLATMAGGDPMMFYPVGRSGQLEVVHSADGWDRDADGLSFEGYIVTLDVAT